MKALSALILFISIAFSGLSQDAIMKRDGSKIDAKVIEITSSTIKYRNFDQPDGPLRNIAINDVQEIIYENGTWEKFEKTEQTSGYQPVTNDPTPIREPKDKILGNGLFIEGMLGMNRITQNGSYYGYYYDEFGNYIEQTSPVTENYASLSIRMGSKWYFGSNEKWRPGVQLTYFKLGLYINPNSNGSYGIGRNSMSLANVGFANAFKFNDKIGMEANANVGFSLINFLPPWNYNPAPGINYGAEVKFRFKTLAVGLDYSRMDANFGQINDRVSMNVYSITIGAKF